MGNKMNILKCHGMLAIVIAAVGTAFSAGAATISKNSGSTAPVMSDFSPVFAGHPNKVGYAHNGVNAMFLESFRVSCEKPQTVVKAKFEIQVRKLRTGRNQSDNDGLGFWDNGVAIFSTHIWTPAEAAGTIKNISYDLAALPSGGLVLNSPGNGMSLLANGALSFSVQDDTSVISARLDYECQGNGQSNTERKGMTWGLYPAHDVSGVATVACQGQPGPDCNAYTGDTMCTAARPVLCMLPSKLPNPASNTQDPQHWSGNVVATTPAVAPASQNLNNAAQVNAYCAAQFGPGWVVADFHAGSGWKFGAYGNTAKSRFWVNIKDQPNGNCWSQ